VIRSFWFIRKEVEREAGTVQPREKKTGEHARQSSMRSLRRLLNQLKEKIARYYPGAKYLT